MELEKCCDFPSDGFLDHVPSVPTRFEQHWVFINGKAILNVPVFHKTSNLVLCCCCLLNFFVVLVGEGGGK